MSATQVVGTLAPLLMLAGLGALLRRIGFLSPAVLRETNRLLFWVALPATLFVETAEAEIQGDAALRVFLVLLAGMIACLILGYLAAWLLHVPRGALGAFVQGSYRSNLAYVGLPVVTLALAAANGEPTQATKSLAVLALAFMVPIYNLTAVVVLLTARPAAGSPGQGLRQLLVALATNPLVLACAAGLLCALFGWKLPPVLRQTCATLGQMSTPLALLGIGASLTLPAVRHNLSRATAAALIKVGWAPAVGFLVASLLRLSPVELRVALIFLACPTASASYIMAEQLGSDGKLAANIIVLSTLLAVPALAVSMLVP